MKAIRELEPGVNRAIRAIETHPFSIGQPTRYIYIWKRPGTTLTAVHEGAARLTGDINIKNVQLEEREDATVLTVVRQIDETPQKSSVEYKGGEVTRTVGAEAIVLSDIIFGNITEELSKR